MHKLAELCVRRPVFATMLVLSLTVVGVYAFFGLGVDLLPNIDIPTVSVSVSNPGSSPEQIETEITKKLEGALNTISGIDELRSTSVEGRSQVTVTFLLEKDGDVAAQEVRDKVNLVIPDAARSGPRPGHPEVRSRRRADPAAGRLQPAPASGAHAAGRQVDQAAARERQRRRTDPDRRRRGAPDPDSSRSRQDAGPRRHRHRRGRRAASAEPGAAGRPDEPGRAGS